MSDTHTNWDQLAQDAENGHYTTDPTQTLHGEAAAAAGREMLRAAFGTDDLEGIDQIRRGRPSLTRRTTKTPGESPMLRVRITPDMDLALTDLSQRRGTTKSELVRTFLAQQLDTAS